MTCMTCGSPDDLAESDDVVRCRSCRERLDWARIIDIVQRGVRLGAGVSFDDAEPAGLGADPFA